jgi:hypothetical protein
MKDQFSLSSLSEVLGCKGRENPDDRQVKYDEKMEDGGWKMEIGG